MAGNGYQNFRLRGIPASVESQKQVRDLVRAALKLDEDSEIAVHSLARNPLENDSRIATLTFGDDPPRLLREPRTEWTCSLPEGNEDEAEKWGPRRLIFDTHFRGFTPLHRADDSECLNDLIAISGLAGHAFGSFKARGSDFMWLRDDLPVRLRQTRILVYGYDTKVVASSSFQNLNDLGNMFRYSIKRLQYGSSAMIKMKASTKIEDQEFLENVIAFMFFGVPHQGMATEHLFPMVGEQPNRSLVQSLGKHSAILQRYEEEFSLAFDSKNPAEILSFYETDMSPTAKFNEEKQIWEFDKTELAVLVEKPSATNGSTSQYAIARNHSEMVKFTSEMDEMYDVVLVSLLPLVENTGS
ncbi:hypothetical protein SLS58_001502 [Diplodia intermedia]|uniref:Uncharacterized protein n=1 Tax=Diplodia intermedia TaxID=856260 RepID=A0ABR3U274_9PEZI